MRICQIGSSDSASEVSRTTTAPTTRSPIAGFAFEKRHDDPHSIKEQKPVDDAAVEDCDPMDSAGSADNNPIDTRIPTLRFPGVCPVPEKFKDRRSNQIQEAQVEEYKRMRPSPRLVLGPARDIAANRSRVSCPATTPAARWDFSSIDENHEETGFRFPGNSGNPGRRLFRSLEW